MADGRVFYEQEVKSGSDVAKLQPNQLFINGSRSVVGKSVSKVIADWPLLANRLVKSLLIGHCDIHEILTVFIVDYYLQFTPC